jgi:hypothetical protein
MQLLKIGTIAHGYVGIAHTDPPPQMGRSTQINPNEIQLDDILKDEEMDV